MIEFSRKLNEKEITASVNFLIRNLDKFDALSLNNPEMARNSAMRFFDEIAPVPENQFLIEELELDILSYINKIGRLAFYSSTIKKIIIPDNITAIGDEAFNCCDDLEEIYFPSSVEKIDYMAYPDDMFSETNKLPKIFVKPNSYSEEYFKNFHYQKVNYEYW